MITMAYWYVILAATIFSTMEIGGKMVSTAINPFQLNFLRFLIGALILLPASIKSLKEKNLKLNKNDLLYFLFTGFLGIVISMAFFQLALIYAKASTIAIIFSTNPIFTIPFAAFLLKEKLNKNTMICLGISLLGIVCILNPFKLNGDIQGILLGLLSAVTFALYSIVGKMRASRYGSMALNCFTFLAGDFILLIIMVVFKIPLLAGVTSENILVILYLGVVVTGLGYLSYFLAMEKTSATTGSIVFFIKPALAPIFALLVLNEKIPFNTLLGMVFILMGSYIKFAENKASTAPYKKITPRMKS